MKPFLAFLFPVAVYFLILGLINRRRRPLVVSGSWDFAGLLFAASGFLFFGGPSILNALRERWQIHALLNTPRPVSRVGPDGFHFWMLLSLLYFAAVVAGAALLLWRRRSQLVIYNIEPPVLDEALAHALDRLGLSWSRSDAHVCIGVASRPSESGPSGDSRRAPAWVQVESSLLLRHVTLSFLEMETPLRHEVESELTRVLSQVHMRANPVGAWFLVLASSLFGLTFFLAMLTIILPAIAQGR